MPRSVLMLLLLPLFLAPLALEAAPDLSAPRQIGKFVTYPDFDDSRLFYFAPGGLEIVRDLTGRPDVRFLQMRYTGTAAYGNQGEFGALNTLTFHMRMDAPGPAELRFLRRALLAYENLGRAELRPLPISRFEALLAYAPIGESGVEPQVVEEGYFEADGSKGGRTSRDAYWRERVFTVPMDPHTATLLLEMMNRGKVALSVSYAFFSKGVHSAEHAQVSAMSTESEIEEDLIENLRAQGVPIADDRPTGVAAKLLRKLDRKARGKDRPGDLSLDEATFEAPVESQMVRAGATGISIDVARWPELVERVDFNEKAPPGYAAVKVYCYDFANRQRPDLFYTKIELEAEAVGGRRVPIDAKFLFSQPDLYARTLRFPVAIRMDKPYRYRVTTAARDGVTTTGAWTERGSWAPILDITSAPLERVDDEEEEG